MCFSKRRCDPLPPLMIKATAHSLTDFRISTSPVTWKNNEKHILLVKDFSAFYLYISIFVIFPKGLQLSPCFAKERPTILHHKRIGHHLYARWGKKNASHRFPQTSLQMNRVPRASSFGSSPGRPRTMANPLPDDWNLSTGTTDGTSSFPRRRSGPRVVHPDRKMIEML